MLSRSMLSPMKGTIWRSFSILSDAFDVSKSPSSWPKCLRSHSCNAITAKNNNEEVTVSGWVDSIRVMKDSVFIVVRDGEGSVQTLFDCDGDGLALRLCSCVVETVLKKIPLESVACVQGIVFIRYSTNCEGSAASCRCCKSTHAHG